MPEKALTASRLLADEQATAALGKAIAQHWPRPLAGSIWLQGDLGAGKTTLARALLRGLGVSGAIRSPTYTLLEPYDTVYGAVLHLDFYRLHDAGDLAMLGLSDTPPDAALWLVEWPERVVSALPPPSLTLAFSAAAGALESGRTVLVTVPEDPHLAKVLHSILE